MIEYWDQYIMAEKGDPRVENWFLLKSSLPTTIILFSWLLFAKVIGWRLMYKRKVFSIVYTKLLVNAVQVILHAYIAHELWITGWSKYHGPCVVCDKSEAQHPMRMARACHLFFLMKIFDLLDAIIFILRRNSSRVTKTHIFHRATMLVQAYLIAKYAPGGAGTLRLLLDCLIHIFTYLYYFASSFNSYAFQRIIWWKHWITRGQIARWMIQVLHDIIILREQCVYPRTITIISLISSSILVLLYCIIYIKQHFQRDLTIFKRHRYQ